jgi:hypothetical protein
MGGHTFSLRGAGETLDEACRPCHADVRTLAVGGGLATRRLADDVSRLHARVKAAVARLDVRGCGGSPPADVLAVEGNLVLTDALGRPLEDCAHVRIDLAAPAVSPALRRAAVLVTLLERDRSGGAHNRPLASELVAEGLALLGPDEP